MQEELARMSAFRGYTENSKEEFAYHHFTERYGKKKYFAFLGQHLD